ncbi:hypothetical protein TNCV_937331 [Trichonephila clavipes]|nr:hypothetical protein TNCV_937331 [Trichonephila clavipes]
MPYRYLKHFPAFLLRSFTQHNYPDGTEEVNLFMDKRNGYGDDETEFDDVPEDITEDEYVEHFSYDL